MEKNLKVMNANIEEAKYEGYIWWSDSKTPVVYDGTTQVALQLDDTANPFVIEGNLWNADKRESIYIRYVDGQHIVRRTIVTEKEWHGINDKSLELGDVDKHWGATTRKAYLSHRITGVTKLRFLQYWEAKADDACEGMAALQPKKLVFVGFNDWK